jgi:phage terminase small subunit
VFTCISVRQEQGAKPDKDKDEQLTKNIHTTKRNIVEHVIQIGEKRNTISNNSSKTKSKQQDITKKNGGSNLHRA